MSAVDLIADAIAFDSLSPQRYVIAIAGPPAAGKTTIAEGLRTRLGTNAAVLGLDAFHFDDAILNSRGHRDRKGAPHTFDVDGYRRTLALLRTERAREIAIPIFDRDHELSRNCAAIVAPSCDIIITEGNYLLLDEPGWSDLAPLFDVTVRVEVSEQTIERRILDRWRGFGLTEAEARQRAERNDVPNARHVHENSRSADLVVAGV